MADILTRLTTMARVVSDEGEEALLEDAAAEIERLRTALRFIIDHDPSDVIALVAHQALEGKE